MIQRLSVCALFALLSACSSAPKETPKAAEEKPKPPVTPAVFRARFITTKGPFVIEVHKDWAPLGADRFYQLIQENYYNGAPIYRVLRGFIAQFGLNKSPAMNERWGNMTIADDPVKQHNTRGTVSFAAAGPSTRTTEVFINLANNTSKLDKQGFAPIGKVVDGMTTVVDKFYSGYGDGPSANGEGPDPSQIRTEGNQYLEIHFPKIDYIKSVELLEPAATPAGKT